MTTPNSDWWDRLYDDGADTTTTAPAAGAPATEPRIVVDGGGAGRMPDWRTGQHADLSAPAADDDDQDDDRGEPGFQVGGGGVLELGEGIEQVPAPGGAATEADVDGGQQDASARRPMERWSDIGADLKPRTRVLLYNGAAAGVGYLPGGVSLVTGWMQDCGEEYSITAALILGLLIVTGTAVLDWRLRAWFQPFRFVVRIPLASAVLALGLYAPAASNL
ncbi:hypothetical protein HUT13_15420 [Streptomyces harbinensis]|uniref:hypothetical protein n=1 Tax=Streptomyces harbinensis TaxID=1176198 RepID=UPI001590B5B9|nr:hypothetical protein [Streptomyces harbinensis]QKV70008.1 hypothetical protein HUT13_15420 [Streptomyces harbinensis]